MVLEGSYACYPRAQHDRGISYLAWEAQTQPQSPHQDGIWGS